MTAMRVMPTNEPTEREYTTMVLELLGTFGWRRVHFRPATVRSGKWATHGSGDITGWPDIFAVRGRRLLALELKVGKGKTTPDQDDWLSALGHAGVEAHVVRPSDWDRLVEMLR